MSQLLTVLLIPYLIINGQIGNKKTIESGHQKIDELIHHKIHQDELGLSDLIGHLFDTGTDEEDEGQLKVVSYTYDKYPTDEVEEKNQILIVYQKANNQNFTPIEKENLELRFMTEFPQINRILHQENNNIYELGCNYFFGIVSDD